MKKKAPLPTGRGAFLHGAAGSGGGMCPHGKVILFSKNRWIFATAKENGCLFHFFESVQKDNSGVHSAIPKETCRNLF